MTDDRPTTADGRPILFEPVDGPQRRALESDADITILGGAAGGGKTAALVAAAFRGMADPGWAGVAFRRTYPEVKQEGGLVDQSKKFCPYPDEHFNASEHRWHLPSGATVNFSHMKREEDKNAWDGAELTFVGFDQLESFEQSQFFHLIGRLRSPDSEHDPHCLATCNPPEGTDHWLYELIDTWWLDDDGYPDPKMAGEVKWFHRQGDDFRWVDGPEDTRDDGSPPLSMTFIPADVEDNPYLSDKYKTQLNSLAREERQRLRFGRWGVASDDSPLAHHAIRTIDEPPDDATGWVRYWDLADTEPGPDQPDPSHTASVKAARVTRQWTICQSDDGEQVCRWHCEGEPDAEKCPACGGRQLSTEPRTVLVCDDPVWFQLAGSAKEQRIKSTAERDGTGVTQGVEQEPGSSGKDVVRKFDRRVLDRWTVVGDRPTGAKHDRRQLWLPLAETGRLWVVDGPQSADFISALEAQDPMDLTDALSGAAKLADESGGGDVFFI